MKKFLAYIVALLFVGVLSLSVAAFADDDPKKPKTDTATTEKCDQHKEAATEPTATTGTTGTTGTKSCCNKSADATSSGCQKSAECKHHDEKTAEAKP
jgi:hypothetical protein